MGLAELLHWNLSLFLLIFSRWAGMVMIAPVFGARGVPGMVKLGLAMSMTVVVYPLLATSSPVIPQDFFPYVGLFIKEILVGLVMGFIINLISVVMQGAGRMLDFQLGFIMANTIDPIHGMQSPMTGNFLMVLTTMILLATNAHHFIIAALVKSYEYLPLNPLTVPNSVPFFIDITSKVIALSVQIALPVYGAVVLADIGVGLLSKIVPQLNMFSVIFPVKIIFGLTLFLFMIPFFGDTVTHIFNLTMQWVFELLRGWGG
ncbi:MAG: flagellar biosynthetic protein FliR [Peptococcaceae bacterium]|nr:flagellar biosynthetic protein FliR [Peptococcaceae bacterium]